MADFNIEEISGLDSQALASKAEEARKAAKELAKTKDEDFTDEQLVELENLTAFISATKEEGVAREAKAAERAEKIKSLRSAVTGEDEKDEDEAPAEEEVPAEVPVAPVIEPVVEEIPAPEGEEEDDKDKKATASAEQEVHVEESPEVQAAAVETAEEPEEKEEAAMVASSNTPSVSDIARNGNAPKEEPEPQAQVSRYSLTASANVANVAPGQEFTSLKDAAHVIKQSLDSLPKSGFQGRVKNEALRFTITDENQLVQDPKSRDDLELLLAAGQQSRLKGGSLLAAGGWGAPSEVLLDFCDIEELDGLIDLPEVTLTRPGVQYTKGPTLGDVLASSTGFWDMTEAVAEAGTELKTSLRPEVPEFTEVRLDAVGAMVEAGLLLRNGWPEVIERYTKLAMTAHKLKMHLKTLGFVNDIAGAAKVITGGFGNALDFVNVIKVMAAGERKKQGLSSKATIEAIVPAFVKTAIRIDLANRNGVDFLAVTDAQIDAQFTVENIRPQWLNHYQDFVYSTTGNIAIGFPTTVKVVLYPAGALVRGVTDVLTLDTVYDSVNLKKNDYVELFLEQGALVANPCYNVIHAEVPLVVSGRTGAADTVSPLAFTAA